MCAAFFEMTIIGIPHFCFRSPLLKYESWVVTLALSEVNLGAANAQCFVAKYNGHVE